MLEVARSKSGVLEWPRLPDHEPTSIGRLGRSADGFLVVAIVQWAAPRCAACRFPTADLPRDPRRRPALGRSGAALLGAVPLLRNWRSVRSLHRYRRCR